jgi:hypothetical protein
MKIPKTVGRFKAERAETDDPAAWAVGPEDLRLTDGGNYDNMGLEPVWKDHEYVLVSDAGGLFDFESDRKLIWRIKRYQAIQETQSRYLRKRWLISNAEAGLLKAAHWVTACLDAQAARV